MGRYRLPLPPAIAQNGFLALVQQMNAFDQSAIFEIVYGLNKENYRSAVETAQDTEATSK